MKSFLSQLLLCVSFLFFANIAFAQLGVPIGAKSKIKEKINREINSNKQTDNGQVQNNANTKRDDYYKRIEAENDIDVFIKSAEPDEQTIKAALAVERSLVDFNKWTDYTVQQAEKIDQVIKNYKNRFEKQGKVAFASFNKVKQYWNICAEFYPNENKIVEAAKKINQFAKDAGADSENEFDKTLAKQDDKKLEDKKMPPAVRTDKNMEALFEKTFNEESNRSSWKRTILKIHLRNNDWIIEYSPTGNITGRKQYAAIVYKDLSTGQCKLSDAYGIYESYKGNGNYSAPVNRNQPAGGNFKCGNEN